MQLSTGRPQEARELEEWIRASGAEYLDGAILAYPDQVGSSEAVILVAGPEATFRRCEGLLRSLRGIQHVGEPVGAASALDCAALSFIFGALLGALHGARVCEVEGLRVDEFGSMLAELVPVAGTEVKHLGGRIQARREIDAQDAVVDVRDLPRRTRHGKLSSSNALVDIMMRGDQHHDVRTTLTLDDDVAAKLKAESRRSGRAFREVVSEALRRGLVSDRRAKRAPFRLRARSLGGRRPGLHTDSVADLLEQVEGPLHK
jgi:hypothetical protein